MITLSQRIPQVIPVPAGGTVDTLLTSLFAELAAGQITGDLIVEGCVVAIVDNNCLGLTSLGGVTLQPTDVFLVQADPGDYDLSGNVDAIDFQYFLAYKNTPNKGNWASGCTYSQTQTLADWVIFLLAYKLAKATKA